MTEQPAFIQGVFAFEGKGLATPAPFSAPAVYKVPEDRRSQTVYFRAGNASDELISFVLTRDGVIMRYFPVGARSSLHVALAVLEDLSPGSVIEVLASAPAGLKGEAVVDVGFMEIL
ncbi:MAG: molybdopterin oxidoreductase [Acidobacteria bacterium]|nr:molybdopterin oxidoreductase [Acidobacteriota bacterium]